MFHNVPSPKSDNPPSSPPPKEDPPPQDNTASSPTSAPQSLGSVQALTPGSISGGISPMTPNTIVPRLTDQTGPAGMMAYLVDSYERAQLQEKHLSKKGSTSERRAVLVACRESCISFSALVLMEFFDLPDLPRHKRTSFLPSPFLAYILYRLYKVRPLPPGFLVDMVLHCHKEMEEDDNVVERVFHQIVYGLREGTSRSSLMDDRICEGFFFLAELCDIRPDGTNFRPICQLLASDKKWLPKESGRKAESETFLGPFLCISGFMDESVPLRSRYLSDSYQEEEAETLSNTIQQRLSICRNELFKVFHSLLRCPETRNSVLEFLQHMLALNTKKTRLHVDYRKFTSHGFMLNLLHVLQQLSLKVKLKMVDPYYLYNPDSRLAISQETRVNCSSKEFEEKQKELKEQDKFSAPVKFPTECFFFTVLCSHIAWIPLFRRYRNYLSEVRRMQRSIAEFEAIKQREDIIQRYRDRLDTCVKRQANVDAVILDPDVLQRSIQFYCTLAEWLSLQAAGEGGPSLPLPHDVPVGFAAIPEFFVDTTAEFVLFCAQYTPHTLDDPGFSHIVTFILLMICSPHYIRNPYLLTKLLEVMFIMTPGLQHREHNKMDLFLSHPLGAQYLAPSLMKFYISCEAMGGSNEFFDKFTVRYHISVVMRSLWEHPIHRAAIILHSKNTCDDAEFIRFVNMLINDTTFLLDESLDALKSIHETQEAMQNQEQWDSQPRELRDSRMHQLSEDERQCRSYLTLANETVATFHYLTREIQETFLRPEMAIRVSTMLNFNLQQLCGPKCRDLKVKDPEKYGFSPKKLLDKLTDIYLHLSSVELARAVAQDEVCTTVYQLVCLRVHRRYEFDPPPPQRSYNKELFDMCIHLLHKNSIKTEVTCQQHDNINSLCTVLSVCLIHISHFDRSCNSTYGSIFKMAAYFHRDLVTLKPLD